MKRPYLTLLIVAFFSMVATVSFAQKKERLNAANLKGIWQMCFYVSETPDSPSTLRAGNTFKILSDDGVITNFTVIPGRGAIVTGVGTYKVVKPNILRESMKKNIHLPMLDGHDNDLEIKLSEDNNVMSVKFYIEKDSKGNVIDAWHYETWRRVEMPNVYPADLVR